MTMTKAEMEPQIKLNYRQLPVYHPFMRIFLAVGTYVEVKHDNQLFAAQILSHRIQCDGVAVAKMHLFPRVATSCHDTTIPFKQVFFTSRIVELPITSVIELCWLFLITGVDDLNNTLVPYAGASVNNDSG